MNSVEERSISSIVHLSHADSKHPLNTARTFLFTKNNIHYLLVLFSAVVRGKKYLHIPREKGNMQPNPISSLSEVSEWFDLNNFLFLAPSRKE